MRIGMMVRPGHEMADAVQAAGAGVFAVGVAGDPETTIVHAAQVAGVVDFARIAVRVDLGIDHPITLAEDLAVLDNISGGRIVALLDTDSLSVDDATEAVSLVRAGLSARPVQHRGRRWSVPAGLAGQDDVTAVQVTPEPVQVEVPTWVMGANAAEIAVSLGIPRIASDPGEVDRAAHVSPAHCVLDGDMDANRDRVTAWAGAGATHLLVAGAAFERLVEEVALHLAPEVAMPDFPRVISETMTPRAWPGPARYVEWKTPDS